MSLTNNIMSAILPITDRHQTIKAGDEDRAATREAEAAHTVFGDGIPEERTQTISTVHSIDGECRNQAFLLVGLSVRREWRWPYRGWWWRHNGHQNSAGTETTENIGIREFFFKQWFQTCINCLLFKIVLIDKTAI